MMFFQVIDAHGQETSFCGCYVPPLHGTLLFDYLMPNLNQLMVEHNYHRITIKGDLNQHIYLKFSYAQFRFLLRPYGTDLPSYNHAVH